MYQGQLTEVFYPVGISKTQSIVAPKTSVSIKNLIMLLLVSLLTLVLNPAK